ncbi:DoxX family protein [Wenxinia marina]|uniref:Putative membrane protein n=1 Tax=Wenxinia marina DSM 24838 TaxID=1123501 RepID=A0A0D0PBC7_9RHOB|nr:DoxX family protein [Wenxinia marina]KIQ68706.1 putative membrane protein [Wenxinia marina DSM 24838]GGL65890.1 hypothetical protein GCM10011392_20650 [Wenxinia marina]
MIDTLTRHQPNALALLRVVTGLLFLHHGTQKLFSLPPLPEGMQGMLGPLFWPAGILEVVGGVLIIIGLFTRPVAFLLSGMMAVAYFLAHASQNFYPALNGGDASILFSFVFLYLVFAGPGAFSVDAARRAPAYA